MSLLFDPSFTILKDDQSARLFNGLLWTSQCFGALAVLCVGIWFGKYGEGFAWNEDVEHEFNYHPMFMVTGMVFLYGEAILAYRIFRNERKKFSKTIHVALHSVTLVFMLIALKAVFDYHNLKKDAEGNPKPIANMISLHSWIGMFVAVSFCIQYIAGFVTYFFPGLPMPIRGLFMPFHQLAGVLIFMIVGTTVALGISERAAWKHRCWIDHNETCGQQIVSSFSGIFCFLYIITVLILVLNPRWKRQPLPEEESIRYLNEEHAMMD